MPTCATDYIDQVLPNRVPSFRHNAAQIEYAASIADCFEHGLGSIHCVEGSTGLGKSLGYLLSAADWIAGARGHRRRVVVATYTRALQRQLVAPGNVELINGFQRYNGRGPLRIATRMGRRNYVSPTRLALALDAETLADVVDDPNRPPSTRGLAHWALTSEGCLLDLDENELPDGIRLGDISIGHEEPLPEVLKQTFADARDADILVINQSLLVMDLLRGGVADLDDAESDVALIVDEAEHFPDVAEEAMSYGLSFNNVMRVARNLGYKTNAERWSALFHHKRDPKLADQAMLISDRDRDEILDALVSIKHTPVPDPDLSANHAAWAIIRSSARMIEQEMRAGRKNLVLSYSPVQGHPRLVCAREDAGAMIRNDLDQRITIFTSATLSDMSGSANDPAFRYLLSRIRINQSDARLGVLRRHEAKKFGQLRFSVPTAPCVPLIRDDEGFALNPLYARFAVNQILAGSPGRTLVLCCSYRDVDSLLEHWPNRARSRAVTHPRGADLNEIAHGMNDDNVLLTPAGWEGLSPSRSGETFWKRVVLLRNPAQSIDPAHLLMTMMAFQVRGLSRVESEAKANRTVHAQMRTKSVHRVRQGIGRALRHPADSAEIVILDPRFRSEAGESIGQLKGLAAAIPQRFRRVFLDVVRPSDALKALPL